ncbi:iron hydrogenase [Ascodesmis nigricans]|uniref:Cytosolic Fe-S cluster assembly factor NAR1 n=1 Tax=Ascodesmis nigricans TaxID=341454 RepID=A0A4S2N820_9PEZI|nr:iron hydrogenase [Ascodesmis nigricans]
MSAILSTDALNDFIAPSVACIKPVESLPPPPSSTVLSVSREDDPSNVAAAENAAQISLTDCLACSGCITSSEAVLIQLQSHTEVLSSLERFPNRRFFAILSLQTVAALAVAWNVTTTEAGLMVDHLFVSHLGFCAVIREEVFREMELHYAAAEVINALQQGSRGSGKHPILASSCPGFICYLETTHPTLIPDLSKVKSPMAIGGMFLKALHQKEETYIVGIQPCLDKKLEGARRELSSSTWRPGDGGSTGNEPERDVDCVLTSREVLLIASERNINPLELPKTPLPTTPHISDNDEINTFLTTPPSFRTRNRDFGTSGGLTSYILHRLYALSPSSTITTTPGRNPDTITFTLTTPDSDSSSLSLARSYGFRNIQNLVRRLKPKPVRRLPGAATNPARLASRRPGANAAEALPVFVEVMACPGGCTNGGGQVKVEDIPSNGEGALSQKELLRVVDEAYFSGDDEARGEEMMEIDSPPAAEVGVEKVVDVWNQVTRVEVDKLVFTTFRQVENDVGNKAGKDKGLEMASKEDGGW